MMINVLPVDYGFHNCFWFSLFRPCWRRGRTHAIISLSVQTSPVRQIWHRFSLVAGVLAIFAAIRRASSWGMSPICSW